ncbi:phospholipase A2, minor isoenzyme-like [Diadema antillarum]|uniref:phospholipase A2, minor isoenzyme-like n=1 Tax=Diadema antillarum TaxID=105358 RepID=UPI003A8B4155
MTGFQLTVIYGLVLVSQPLWALESVENLADDISQDASHLSRAARSLPQFALMIKCMTGRWPLDYNNYGCYCGFGGRGAVLDGVDRCCKIHDDCYTFLLETKTCRSLAHVYLQPYRFKKTNRWIYEGALWIECHSKGSCSKGLCECDRQAALCFSLAPYNAELKKLNRKELCRG